MGLPRAYRNYIGTIPQWSIRVTGGYADHPLQGVNTPVQPPRDCITVSKLNIDEYLYLRLVNACPGSYYVMSEITLSDGVLIAVITNKTGNEFEIINVNPIPI